MKGDVVRHTIAMAVAGIMTAVSCDKISDTIVIVQDWLVLICYLREIADSVLKGSSQQDSSR
jgi:hypothetical protein